MSSVLYEPPVNFSGLAKSLRPAVYHSSPIYVKRNILASTYIPHPLLSRQDFSRLVLDYLVFANGYLEKRLSVAGQLMKLETSPAKYTRTNLRPARCFICLSPISIKSFTGCRNT